MRKEQQQKGPRRAGATGQAGPRPAAKASGGSPPAAPVAAVQPRPWAELAELQPRAVTQLTQALAGQRPAHAFFLVGGRASHAPQLAETLTHAWICPVRVGRAACGQCPSCKRWHAGHHPNVHRLGGEADARVGVAEVRGLRSKLALSGHDGAPVVVLLPRAGLLQIPAQQALLKMLEEPQPGTTFVLVADHVAALLPTLRSRMAILQLGQHNEQAARARLEASGVPLQLASWAALYVGDDAAAAEALIDAGLGQVLDRLEVALGAGQDVPAMARAAQELGQSAQHFQLASHGLALYLRDALLGRVRPGSATGGPAPRSPKSNALVGHVATNQLCAAADALLHLLAANVPNLSRPLALEGLFLLLNQSSVT